jgi:hypothetical protein
VQQLGFRALRLGGEFLVLKVTAYLIQAQADAEHFQLPGGLPVQARSELCIVRAAHRVRWVMWQAEC